MNRIMDAAITTATVDIRILRVSGNKMTLAVFRQLPQIDPWDMNFRVQPGRELWGTVNYCPKDCEGPIGLWHSDYGRTAHHQHVVWACSGEISRVAFPTNRSLVLKDLQRKESSGFLGGPEAAKAIGEWHLLKNRISELPQLFIAV